METKSSASFHSKASSNWHFWPCVNIQRTWHPL